MAGWPGGHSITRGCAIERGTDERRSASARLRQDSRFNGGNVPGATVARGNRVPPLFEGCGVYSDKSDGKLLCPRMEGKTRNDDPCLMHARAEEGVGLGGLHLALAGEPRFILTLDPLVLQPHGLALTRALHLSPERSRLKCDQQQPPLLCRAAGASDSRSSLSALHFSRVGFRRSLNRTAAQLWL